MNNSIGIGDFAAGNHLLVVVSRSTCGDLILLAVGNEALVEGDPLLETARGRADKLANWRSDTAASLTTLSRCQHQVLWH